MENNFQDIHQEEEIDIRSIFYKILRFWYLFIIIVPISLFIAFVYNKYTQPIYQNSTTVLISDDKKGSAMTGTKDMSQGFGLFFNRKSVENELIVLNSYSLTEKAVKELDLNISYYKKLFVGKKELYKNAPFVIKYDSVNNQFTNFLFQLTVLSDKTYRIEAEAEKIRAYNFKDDKYKDLLENYKINKIGKFGEVFVDKNIKFTINTNNFFNKEEDIEQIFYFKINTIGSLIAQYRSKTNVSVVSEEASVVRISMTDFSPKKTVDFLNKLTEVYLRRNLDKKNRIAVNTVNFINDLLTEITDSLTYTENKLQDFRKDNNVMDLSFKAQGIYEQMQKLETKRAEFLVKAKYYDYLRTYFNKNQDVSDLLAPSSMGVEDKLLNALIIELTKTNAERNSLNTDKEKNPLLKQLNKKLQNIKSTILENLDNIVETSKISIKDIDNRVYDLEKEIGQLPQTERKLFKIERQFKLNDAIYTYLLQKRAEAQIARASNIPDNEVIDYANLNVVGSPISPKKRLNYLIALFLGIIFPVGFVLFKELLNDKILEKKDVEKITKFSLLGHVFNNDKKSPLIIKNYPSSRIAESIRSIRTNLQFYTKGKEKQVILFTSSVAGEGKTFCAINLATAYAKIEKKTLLIGFDLRKPKLQEIFGLKNHKGVSDFLISKEKNIDEFIQKTGIPNLDILVSGAIPPNPLELIVSSKTKDLMEQVTEQYEYIFLDTPPIGVVSETHILSEFADTNIYVVRQNFTKKRIFEATIKDIEANKKSSKYTILVNDVKFDSYNHYGYSYGYGAGYYNEEKTFSWKKIKRLFTNKKNKETQKNA